MIKDFMPYIKSVIAIEPCYGRQGGNATRIYTRRGEVFEDNRRLLTILNKIVSYYGADLTALRQLYGEYLGLSQSVPLPLSPILVWVPIKTRSPDFADDGATGYVNACAVIRIEAADPGQAAAAGVKCWIHLQDGAVVPCCFTPKVVAKRLRLGRQALDRFLSLQEGEAGHEPVFYREQLKSEWLQVLFDRIMLINKLILDLILKFSRKGGGPFGPWGGKR